MADVFVSYARSDKARVAPLVAAIEAKGWSVWWDPEITPGQEFDGLGKISALGIKVSRHCSYHGVALNVDMDLEPFHRINPCGYVGLQTVDLAFCGVHTSWEEAASRLGEALAARLSP